MCVHVSIRNSKVPPRGMEVELITAALRTEDIPCARHRVEMSCELSQPFQHRSLVLFIVLFCRWGTEVQRGRAAYLKADMLSQG